MVSCQSRLLHFSLHFPQFLLQPTDLLLDAGNASRPPLLAALLCLSVFPITNPLLLLLHPLPGPLLPLPLPSLLLLLLLPLLLPG